MKAILTRYHGATNTRGSRISATDSDKNRVSISYPHELNSDKAHALAAKTLCEKMNWHGEMIGGGLHNGDMVWTFAISNDRFIAGPETPKPTYSLEAGRSILKDGLPFVHLARSVWSDNPSDHAFNPSAADDFARAIVEKFNK